MVSSQAMISAPREGDSGTGQSRPFALRFNGNPVRIWSEYLDDQLVSLGFRAFLEPRPPPYLSPENRPVPITCRTSAFHPTPSPENCPAIMSDSFRAPTKLMTDDQTCSPFPRNRPGRPRSELDLLCTLSTRLECMWHTNRAASAASSTYTSRNTPPLASARNFSFRHHYIATSPLLHHYSTATSPLHSSDHTKSFFDLLKAIRR